MRKEKQKETRERQGRESHKNDTVESKENTEARPFLRKAWSFLRILRGASHLIFKPFLRKAWSFLRILRWAGHLILRPFLRKAWIFLRILRWAGHPILRPFLRKAWSFLKNFKRGRLPDIETVS